MFALLALRADSLEGVTKADLSAILDRLAKLEAENKAQAAKIAELEKQNLALAGPLKLQDSIVAQIKTEESTTTNSTGRIFTTESVTFSAARVWLAT